MARISNVAEMVPHRMRIQPRVSEVWGAETVVGRGVRYSVGGGRVITRTLGWWENLVSRPVILTG